MPLSPLRLPMASPIQVAAVEQSSNALAACDDTPSCLSADYYGRQVLLPQLGVDGQEAIRGTRVLIVGCGGLGSTAIPYAAGVGFERLILVDHDVVEKSNLHRQTLHAVDSIGEPKVFSARRRCLGVNPSCLVETFAEPLTEALGTQIFPRVDIVLDCTDNLPTRLLISDLAAVHGKIVVSGSALRCQGQMLTYSLRGGYGSHIPPGCYRCLLGEAAKPPASIRATSEIEGDVEALVQKIFAPLPVGSQDCGSEGVLGPVPGVIGLQMVLQAVRLATFKCPRLRDSLPVLPNYLLFDYTNVIRPMMTTTLAQKNAAQCVCANPRLISPDYHQVCEAALHPDDVPEVSVTNLSLSVDGSLISIPQWDEPGPNQRATCFIDVRPRHHSVVGTLPGALIWPLDELTYELKAAVRCADSPVAELPTKLRDALRFLESLPHNEDDRNEENRLKEDQYRPPALGILVFCRRGNASRSAVRLLRYFFAIRKLQLAALKAKQQGSPITKAPPQREGGLPFESLPPEVTENISVLSLKGGISAVTRLPGFRLQGGSGFII